MADQAPRPRSGTDRIEPARRSPPMSIAVLIVALVAVLGSLLIAHPASAATPEPDIPTLPDVPTAPERPAAPDDTPAPDTNPDGLPGGPDLPGFELPEPPDPTPGARTGDVGDGSSATFSLDVPDVTGDSSNAVVIILLLSVLSVAPSLLIMLTSYTRIVIVMSMTRQAMGIPQLPPQQVIVGISLFLTLFVMGPTLTEMNDVGLQPLLNGDLSFTEAADAATGPLREFMLGFTREGELKLFLDASGTETPVARDAVPLTALIPAFVLSELKSAFILGFIIFVPFVVIDLVVSAVLTSLGMMMLPPTFVSLPLKLLLFILLDGWTLIVGTLLQSYQ